MKNFYTIVNRKYSKKTLDEIKAKIHKHNINTITMVKFV